MDRPAPNLDEIPVVLDFLFDDDLRDEIHGLVDMRMQRVEVVAERSGFLLGPALAEPEMHPGRIQTSGGETRPVPLKAAPSPGTPATYRSPRAR